MSKPAMHSLAGFIALEHGKDSIQCFNVQPGFIATQRIAHDMAEHGFAGDAGSPPRVIAETVLWLATSPDAVALKGQVIKGQQFCLERGLLPGWNGLVR